MCSCLSKTVNRFCVAKLLGKWQISNLIFIQKCNSRIQVNFYWIGKWNAKRVHFCHKNVIEWNHFVTIIASFDGVTNRHSVPNFLFLNDDEKKLRRKIIITIPFKTGKINKFTAPKRHQQEKKRERKKHLSLNINQDFCSLFIDWNFKVFCLRSRFRNSIDCFSVNNDQFSTKIRAANPKRM